MGRKRDIAEGKKAAILALLKTKRFTFREISKREGVSLGTVANLARNLHRGNCTSTSRRRNCGNTRITTDRTDRRIIATLAAHRQFSYRDILKILHEEGINISLRTLKRRSKEAGFACRRPIKKPRLTKRMRKARLEFAKQHQDFTNLYWNQVIFSDEATFHTMTESSSFIRRRAHEKYDPSCIQQTIKHPPSVMVWACISGYGPGPLHIVQGIMNADSYVELLDTVVRPYYDSLVPTSDSIIFMQDGAPCHTAKKVQKFLQDSNIPILPWPGNSPDLNPIENVWALLKLKTYRRQNLTKDILIRNIKELWHGDPEIRECIHSCIQSMGRRIKEVVKRRGGVTRF